MCEKKQSKKMKFQTIRDIAVKGKTVLLRADLNVPRQNSEISDTTRIDRLKPTIKYLCAQGAKVLLLSHFGRPEGEQNPEMSLAFLTGALEKSWGVPTRFAPDCIGDNTDELAQAMPFGEVMLLENVRFYTEESKNDPVFAKKLASLGDIYVNDAFSASHRAHASTAAIASFLPTAAGFLMEEELNALSAALVNPEKPLAAVTGGSKISSKLNVLYNLVEKADYLILGGGMANTFLYAAGHDMGKSLCEKDMRDEAQKIMRKAKDVGCEIILPRDVVAVSELKEHAKFQTISVDQFPADRMAIDVGPETISYIQDKLKKCKTIVWNGPLGVFEIKPFDNGTNVVAQFVSQQTQIGNCISVAGGGDTISALDNAGAAQGFSYISTAGGAFLEWLEGRDLPGITALYDAQNDKAA